MIYETIREDELGIVIPQMFCNCCKMIFEIENDSPYLSDDKTYEYLKEKLHKQFNTRKPMQEIVEKLKMEESVYRNKASNELAGLCFEAFRRFNYKADEIHNAIEIVKEVGGMNG